MGCAPSTPTTRPKILYVILPYSNPINFKRRSQLMNQTISHLIAHAEKLRKENPTYDLQVVVSELSYNNPPTSAAKRYKHPFNCLFSTTKYNILWSKENLVNLAIRNIIARDEEAEYFAWIDADILFDSPTWVIDTINLLTTTPNTFIQLFQTASLLDPTDTPYQTVTSFAHQYTLHGSTNYKSVSNSHPNYWHPGFAWASTKSTLLKLGGLIERTFGSADRHMAMCIIERGQESMPDGLTDGYRALIAEWEQRAKGITLCCTPGNVRHKWHGDVANRQYMGRWEILKRWNFDPLQHLVLRSDGLLVWARKVEKGFKKEVVRYFRQRDEDSNVMIGHTNGSKPAQSVKKPTPNKQKSTKPAGRGGNSNPTKQKSTKSVEKSSAKPKKRYSSLSSTLDSEGGIFPDIVVSDPIPPDGGHYRHHHKHHHRHHHDHDHDHHKHHHGHHNHHHDHDNPLPATFVIPVMLGGPSTTHIHAEFPSHHHDHSYMSSFPSMYAGGI